MFEKPPLILIIFLNAPGKCGYLFYWKHNKDHLNSCKIEEFTRDHYYIAVKLNQRPSALNLWARPRWQERLCEGIGRWDSSAFPYNTTPGPENVQGKLQL